MIDYIRKNFFIIIGGVVVFFLLINFLVLNTYYSVNLKTKPSGNTTLKVGYLDDNLNVKQSTSIFGIYMVPRGANVIVTQMNNQEAHSLVQGKLLIGINTITVDVRAQRELSKVGRGGLGCNSIDDTFKVFTYSCYGASNTVFTFANKKNAQFENQPLSTELSNDRLVTKPYKGGLLSLVPREGNYYLEYTDIANDTLSQQALPYISSDSLNLYTNTSNDSFVVVNNTAHEVLSYESISSQAKKLAFSKDLRYTTCHVMKFSFSCIAAPPVIEHSDDDDGDSHSADSALIKDARLIAYNTMTKRQSSQKLNESIDTVCQTNKGVYFVGSNNTLLFMPRDKDKTYTIAKNITAFDCTNSAAFYTDGKSLYRSDDGNSSLLLRESHLDIASLYVKSNKILIDTTVNGESQPVVHTYEVTESPLQAKRLESILPYPEGGEIPILEMDYDNDNFYIKPQLSVISDKETGQSIIDEEDLVQVKKQIENKLNEDGVLSARKIVYYFN